MTRIAFHLHHSPLAGFYPDPTTRWAFTTDGGVPGGHASRNFLVGNHIGDELFHPLGGTAEHGCSGATGSNHFKEIPPFDSFGHELKPLFLAGWWRRDQ